MLEVESLEAGQRLELVSLQRVDGVVVEVEHLQPAQPVERVVQHRLDPRVVEVQHAQLFPADEAEAGNF